MRPRLRSTVQAHRQHFRGMMWYVLQDPSNNEFSRLSESAYRFVALLDGQRKVADAWRICNEQMGDSAPTQGEAIQLMGQLYTANLLHAELPPDAAGLLERFRKRKVREIQSYLMNLLFIRIPLIDPDEFLNRWVHIFGKLFTWYGLVFWVLMVGAGFYFVAGRFGELGKSSAGVLDPENLPLLYLVMFIRSLFHEFGHAFSCKRFGKISGSGGEVHVMGVMFLVFAPFPYVDASSMWAFRSKWHRSIVCAAGMLVELPLAAIAAILWAQTAEGTAIHALAYNMMFLSSVSTVLFNANPLLRYDGYYMLSDLLEIPNLAPRSKEFLYYLVRRYVYGVKKLRSPAHTRGERIWFVFYGISSGIYRVFISFWILMFVADKLFLLGAVLAVAGLIAWVCVPLVKFVRYLATSNELLRVRARAVALTLAAAAALVVGVGFVSVPDRFRVEGVVEPPDMTVVHAGADGFVEEFLPSGTAVTAGGPVLIRAVNKELECNREALAAERRGLEARQRAARTQDLSLAQTYAEQIVVVDEQIARADKQLADLEIRPTHAGTWISPEIERTKGAYLRRGDTVGILASLDKVVVRSFAGQESFGSVFQAYVHGNVGTVQLRVKGRPDMRLTGTIEKILPAGQDRLPAASLGYNAGGSIQTAVDDPKGIKSAERLFEIRIIPSPDSPVRLLAGQRVIARLEVPAKPLIVQWWRAGLQLVQKRFHS
jgi:putative peptide zinc metalloprotease protein